MKKLLFSLAAFVFIFGLCFTVIGAPEQAFAQSLGTSMTEQMNTMATKVYGTTPKASLPETIGSIINVALTLFGIVLTVLIIYGGFLWMTAGGDEGKVTKAKEMIKNAVIGLLIILAAYAISSFVINALITATT